MLLLKQLRLARHLNQQAVADAIGITRGAYANLQLGRRDPDTDTLSALARFFNVSTDFILGIEKTGDISAGQVDDLKVLYSQLNPQNQDKARSYIRYLLEREQPDNQGP